MIGNPSASRVVSQSAGGSRRLYERDVLGRILATQAPSGAEGQAQGAPDDRSLLRHLHVLLVDDHPDILDLLTVVLDSYGAVVTAAGSAAEALGALDRDDVDVIVSDIRMPGMDGYSFLREVRRRTAQRGGAIPAIAITAHGETEDRQRARDAGFQMHFRKPVDHLELVRAVATVAC